MTAVNPCKPLGKALKEARRNIKLNQIQFQDKLKEADEIGLFKANKEENKKSRKNENAEANSNKKANGSSTLTQYETGRRVPSPDRLRRLAFCLGVTTDELLGMYDERFFYRIINNLVCRKDPSCLYEATLALSDKNQAEDEWPNKDNRKLDLKVRLKTAYSSPGPDKLTLDIGELKKIQEESWMQYEDDLKRRIDDYLYDKITSVDETLLSDLSLYIALVSILPHTVIEKNPVIQTLRKRSPFTDTVKEFGFYDLCKHLQNEKKLIFALFGKRICALVFFFCFTGIDPLLNATALIFHALKNRVDELLGADKHYDMRDSFNRGIKKLNNEMLFAKGEDSPETTNNKDWSKNKALIYQFIFDKLYKSNQLPEIIKPENFHNPYENACHKLILHAARSFCNIPAAQYDDTEKKIRHFSETDSKDIEHIKICLLDKLTETNTNYLKRCKTWKPKSLHPDDIWYYLIDECEKIRKELYPALPAEKEKPPKPYQRTPKDTLKDDNR